jgi:hypothetical protein
MSISGGADESVGTNAVRSAIDRISELEGAGWAVVDGLESLTAKSTVFPTATAAFSAAEKLFDFCIELVVTNEFGYQLRRVSSQPEISFVPSDFPARYSAEIEPLAQRAADGDVDTALHLNGRWVIDVVLDLAAPLSSAYPGTSWRVVRDNKVLEGAFAGPWWRIGDFLDSGKTVVVLVGEATPPCGGNRLAVRSLEEYQAPEELPTVNSKREAVESACGRHDSLPLPEDLVQIGHLGSGPFANKLQASAAALAWAWLATEVEPLNSSAAFSTTTTRLAFFGYRRLEVTLGPEGITEEPTALAALQLYRWATDEESSDKIVAIRQVASVYDSTELFESARDVERAAAPIYKALRAGAISDLLEAQSAARGVVFDAARQAAAGAVDGSKSVAERTLASLGALGGLILAQSTTHIPLYLIRDAGEGLAGFLVFLALWAIFVEGPSLSPPLRSLSSDLKASSPLLTSDVLKSIVDMASVSRARHAVCRIRWLAPIVYLSAAAVAAILAYSYH